MKNALKSSSKLSVLSRFRLKIEVNISKCLLSDKIQENLNSYRYFLNLFQGHENDENRPVLLKPLTSSQSEFTCSKLTVKTLEKGVK